MIVHLFAGAKSPSDLSDWLGQVGDSLALPVLALSLDILQDFRWD